MRATFVGLLALLAIAVIAPRPAVADVNVSIGIGGPVYPPGPAPYGPYGGYGYFPYYPPPYYPPPAFYLGSGWDPDYRDLRYNRYFQRSQPPPAVRGFTFGP